MTDINEIIGLEANGRWEERGNSVFGVEAPFEMDRDAPEIIGRLVKIEGKTWRVLAVERYLPKVPIWVGEAIGLMVEPAEENYE